MQLGRKLADGYAADPELEEIAPPVVEIAAEPMVELETMTEPVRA